MLRHEGLSRGTKIAAALLAAVLAATLVFWGARSADAALPGTNGLIAFISLRDGDFEIFTMNPDDPNNTLTQLTHNTATDYSPTWSPDGAQIAFVSTMTTGQGVDNPSGDAEIFTIDADDPDNTLTQLTHNLEDDSSPTWSPVLSSGGTKIAFVSTRAGYYDIYMMSSDGSNEVRLTKNSALDHSPTWSPTGTKIAFHSTRLGANNYEVYAMKPRPEGKRNRPVNLSRHSSNDENPNWSPDGTQIAFRSQRGVGGDHEIYVMDADGTDQSPVTENRYFDHDPAWSPDGTQITFTRQNSPESGGFEVYKVDAGGDPETNVTNNSANDQSPDWQPIPATSGG